MRLSTKINKIKQSRITEVGMGFTEQVVGLDLESESEVPAQTGTE